MKKVILIAQRTGKTLCGPQEYPLTTNLRRDKITPMRAWWNWQTRWI